MNAPTKLILTFLALGSVGAGGYYLLGGQTGHSGYEVGEGDTMIDPLEEGDDPSVSQSADADAEQKSDERRESVTMRMDEKISSPATLAKLQVEGKVLTTNGLPVKDARVGIFARKNFDWAGVMRRGNRGGGRGGMREAMNNPEIRNFRDGKGDYKVRRIGKELRTNAEGRFAMDAETFASAQVELTVQHDIYAPVVVDRQWEEKDGKLVLDKIEVEAGGKIIGSVLSKSGGPIADAKVQFSQRNQRRGGRGGPGRGPMGMGLGTTERLRKLLGEIRTNESGQFVIPNAPPGDFSLTVEQGDYLPGRSKNLTLEAGATIDAGIIQLEMGAILTGIVRNQDGKPVAAAKVNATVSQDFIRKKLTEVLKAKGLGELDQAWRNEAARNDPEVSYLMGLMGGGGRGGRGMFNRGGRNQNNNGSETDKEGKYRLTRLPHAPLRLSVRHGEYLDEDKDGIDPDKTPTVDVTVQKRLGIAGVVINASTGETLTSYGIKAREVRTWDLPENVRQSLGLATTQDNGRRGNNRFGGNRNGPTRNGPTRNGAARNGGNRNGGNRNGGNRNGGNRNGGAGRQANATPRQLTPEQLQRQAEMEKRRAERQAKMTAEQQQRELERKQREAERTARAQERDRQRLQVFGTSGVPYRGDPKVEKHEDGTFELPRLNPGIYVLDIQAPGFRKIAAGPYKLDKGTPIPPVQIRLERGRSIQGVVATHRGKPIAGAEVELLIPPTNQPQDNQGNQGNFMANMFRRGQNNGTRLDRVRTDSEGRFSIEGQTNGSFRLLVTAEGYTTWMQDNLQIANRDVTGLKVKLAQSGKIFGRVLNMPENETVNVSIVSDNGTRRNTRADPKTGEYSEEDLDPGSYLVRLTKGGNFMGGVISALSQPGGPQPNVILGEGEQRRFDLDAGQEELGKIEGLVYLNGTPAGGLTVQLEPIEGQGGLDPSAMQGMGRMRRFLGRMFQGRTDKDGKYSIDNIPPGNYDLLVRRRGRGGERTIHKELARIGAGSTQHLNYSLILGSIQLTVTDQEGKPVNRARITMALSSEVGGLQPNEWRNLPSYQRANLRGGKLSVQDLKVGEYQYQIQARQMAPKRDRLFVAAPPAPSEVKIILEKAAPAKKAAPANAQK